MRESAELAKRLIEESVPNPEVSPGVPGPLQLPSRDVPTEVWINKPSDSHEKITKFRCHVSQSC